MKVLKSMLIQIAVFLVLVSVASVAFVGGVSIGRWIYSDDHKAMNEIRRSAEIVVSNPYPAPKGQIWCEDVDINNLKTKSGEQIVLKVCSEVGK